MKNQLKPRTIKLDDMTWNKLRDLDPHESPSSAARGLILRNIDADLIGSKYQVDHDLYEQIKKHIHINVKGEIYPPDEIILRSLKNYLEIEQLMDDSVFDLKNIHSLFDFSNLIQSNDRVNQRKLVDQLLQILELRYQKVDDLGVSKYGYVDSVAVMRSVLDLLDSGYDVPQMLDLMQKPLSNNNSAPSYLSLKIEDSAFREELFRYKLGELSPALLNHMYDYLFYIQ